MNFFIQEFLGLKNYDYVYKISSQNLEQLLGPLRNNGSYSYYG